MLTIETPSRLHITLIDMNGSQGRIDGSVGVALDYPRYKARFSKANKVRVVGCDAQLEKRIYDRVETFYRNYQPLPGLYCAMVETIPAHKGLGSGTQLSLMVAQAFNQLYELGLSIPEMAKIMQRGGTSSLGAFFFAHGGFLVDGGHDRKDKSDFLPSRFTRDVPLCPIVFRHEIPSNWKVLLCIPNSTDGLSGEGERDFMASVCPIAENEVEKACRIILMKMMPAVVEGNLARFGESIAYLQDNGWKKLHWQRAANKKNLFMRNVLESIGLCGVGLSSTGNTIFGFYDFHKEAPEALRSRFNAQIGNEGVEQFTLIFTSINSKGNACYYEAPPDARMVDEIQ